MAATIKIALAAICCCCVIAKARAFDTSRCIGPLGMESGAIPNEDISASSSFDSSNVGPKHGRARTEINGGAWCPKSPITTESKEWLEVNLHTVHLITAVETQGRFGNGQGQEFAEAFIIEYWRPKIGKWIRYRDVKGGEVFEGNTNTYISAKRLLNPPVWATRIRFLPYSYHQRTVCMRVEIYGCRWKNGIVSYSMPQGDKRGSGFEFFDATYDGHWDGELRRGLGQLTDGKYGPENFKMGYYEFESGQGWVGWRNDTRSGQPVEIKFEFDKVREFTAVNIYCNNQFTKDVQVFSQADIMFSVGGRHFLGEPITYNYIEDRIFEHSRNISIKLHHRIGRFVKLQLHFAAKWIMISEVTFDSDVAHGNFSVEIVPEDVAVLSDDSVEKAKQPSQHAEPPVSTAKDQDHTYTAIIIAVLTALLLTVILYVIISRYRQRKCFSSPRSSKPALPGNHLADGSGCGSMEKGGTIDSYAVKEIDDNYNQPKRCITTASTLRSLPRLPDDRVNGMLHDYQEPYHALKYPPYYSTAAELASTLVSKNSCPQSDCSYDYAVPETGTMPLLSQETSTPLPMINSVNSDKDYYLKNSSSKGSKSDDSKGKKTPSQQETLSELERRLEQMEVPEFPRRRLRMLSKLSEGTFGTTVCQVFVAEAPGLPEYGCVTSNGNRLVAVKSLLPDATENEKMDFHRDIQVLAVLEDPNIARVLAMCSHEEPLCAVMEYLEHGDLNQFLRMHVPAEVSSSPTMPGAVKTLSFNCLLHMATEIASGMKYLETINFVHRDLATRNCLVGKAYSIKISDFGTNNELYAADYYKRDGKTSQPIRWMAWESLYWGKYTTKSDVWAFAVTFWEILNFGRRMPFEEMSNSQVIANLAHIQRDDGQFCRLPRPTAQQCTKDIYDLMLQCWLHSDAKRPFFWEILLFLKRKNLGYTPSA